MQVQERTCRIKVVADDGSLTLVDVRTDEVLTGIRFLELTDRTLDKIRGSLSEPWFVVFDASGALRTIGQGSTD